MAKKVMKTKQAKRTKRENRIEPVIAVIRNRWHGRQMGNLCVKKNTPISLFFFAIFHKIH